MMVALEFFKNLFRLFHTQAFFDRVVVVQREVPFWILVGSHAPFFGMLRDWRVLAEVKRAEPHGVDQVLVLLEELDGGPGLVARISWEAQRSDRVMPDSDLCRPLSASIDD